MRNKERTADAFRDFLGKIINERQVLILGFGREGKSSLSMLDGLIPDDHISIADILPQPGLDALEGRFRIYTGPEYLRSLEHCELVLRSPGVPDDALAGLPAGAEVSSQTELFLRYYSTICIGITGTKGKSTTATLVTEMLKCSGVHAALAGNIGLPPFEVAVQAADPAIRVVLELSAHQLGNIRRSPHLGCILNLFEEHLDHFSTTERYFRAKWRLGEMQSADDLLVLDGTDANLIQMHARYPVASRVAYFSGPDFKGHIADDYRHVRILHDEQEVDLDLGSLPAFRGLHQRRNAIAAAMLALHGGAQRAGIQQALENFRGLPHRLEYLGSHRGIHIYNDAIATIPEAVIAALQTLGTVDTLLLGGMDRGIDYSGLVTYLASHPPRNIIFSGPAGQRMLALLRNSKLSSYLEFAGSFAEAIDRGLDLTLEGGILLLSPAAPSYDEFKDFTEKGQLLRKRTGNL